MGNNLFTFTFWTLHGDVVLANEFRVCRRRYASQVRGEGWSARAHGPLVVAFRQRIEGGPQTPRPASGWAVAFSDN